MICEFRKTRLFRLPKSWANSVARWIMGVHSPGGTVKITNTLEPKSGGSLALDVNLDAIASELSQRMDSREVTNAERERIKTFVRGFIDGVSVKMRGEHISVDSEWLYRQIRDSIKEELEEREGQLDFPEDPTQAGSMTSGVPGQNVDSFSADSGTFDFTDTENNGTKIFVLSRVQSNGMDVRLYFREWTLTPDGRIARIGYESKFVTVAVA